MKTPGLLLATILFQAQDDAAAAKARAFLDKLRSDRIEEREEAARGLRSLGKDALPFLRKVAQDPDLEVSGRAVALIRTLDVREKLRSEAREQGSVDAASVVEWLIAESGRRVLSADDMNLARRRIRVSPETFGDDAGFDLAVDLLKTIDVAVAQEPGKTGVVTLFPAVIGGKKALPLYTSREALPRGNEFCTLVVNLKHVSAREVQAVLINMSSFPQNCLSVETSGKVILTDYAGTLRKLALMIAELDQPGPPSSYRLSLALLVGRTEAAADVPARFRSVKLAETVGRNHFALMGEALARVDRPDARPVPGAAPGKPAEPPSTLTLRLGGTPPHGVELQFKGGPAEALTVERLTLSLERDPALPKGAPLLETRLVLPKGEWVIAGAVPGHAEGTTLVLLVRADAE